MDKKKQDEGLSIYFKCLRSWKTKSSIDKKAPFMWFSLAHDGSTLGIGTKASFLKMVPICLNCYLRALLAKVVVIQVLVVWRSNVFFGVRSKHRHNAALDVTYILIL